MKEAPELDSCVTKRICELDVGDVFYYYNIWRVVKVKNHDHIRVAYLLISNRGEYLRLGIRSQQKVQVVLK